MMIEEELLYYLKLSITRVDANKDVILDPNYEANLKNVKEFMDLLKDIIASKKNGEDTYCYIDYESDEMKSLIKNMKRLADSLTELGDSLN